MAELTQLGRRAGLDAIGVAAGAAVPATPAAISWSGEGPGCTGAWRSPIATRSARPTPAAPCRASPPSWSGAGVRPRPRPRRPAGRRARTARLGSSGGAVLRRAGVHGPARRDGDGSGGGVRPGRPLRRAARRARCRRERGCGPTGWRGRGRGRRQRPRRPGGRLPGRARLVRQERQPAAARPGQLVRARARCSPTPPLPTAADAGGRRLRDAAGGASTAARPAPSSRRAWSTPAGAWPGWCRPTGRFPVEHRVALGDRLYGCDDCQEVCPPNRRLARHDAARPAGAGTAGPEPSRLGRPARAARGHRRRAARPPRPLVHPRPRPALPAPQRAGRARQHRRRLRDAAVVDTLRRLPGRRRAAPTPVRPRARRTLGRAAGLRPVAPRRRPVVKHLLVTNDFPPKVGGIQSYLWELWRRLPPDDVTVLTTPYPGAAAWDAAQPFRVERGTRAGAAAHAARCAGGSTAWPTRSAPSWCCSTRPCRSGLLGPRLEPALRRRAPRRRGHRARPAAGRRGGCCGRVLAGRRPRGRRRRLPGGRGRAGRRPAGCPVVVVPPGVDTERFRPLDAGRAGARPGSASACPDGAASCSASAGWCPARASTC